MHLALDSTNPSATIVPMSLSSIYCSVLSCNCALIKIFPFSTCWYINKQAKKSCLEQPQTTKSKYPRVKPDRISRIGVTIITQISTWDLLYHDKTLPVLSKSQPPGPSLFTILPLYILKCVNQHKNLYQYRYCSSFLLLLSSLQEYKHLLRKYSPLPV